ncbi:hypothetical protein LIER_24944 [Lithospermum erythrorhizon]|uniref:Uncharacterized protein n=1 Tax=Lithospermum erythrorhizon TaxID=34254 RepID=A0AAV3R6N3_LITER
MHIYFNDYLRNTGIRDFEFEDHINFLIDSVKNELCMLEASRAMNNFSSNVYFCASPAQVLNPFLYDNATDGCYISSRTCSQYRGHDSYDHYSSNSPHKINVHPLTQAEYIVPQTTNRSLETHYDFRYVDQIIERLLQLNSNEPCGEEYLIIGQEEFQPVHVEPQQEVHFPPFAFHDIQISSSEHEHGFLDDINDVIDFKFKEVDMVDVLVEENFVEVGGIDIPFPEGEIDAPIEWVNIQDDLNCTKNPKVEESIFNNEDVLVEWVDITQYFDRVEIIFKLYAKYKFFIPQTVNLKIVPILELHEPFTSMEMTQRLLAYAELAEE